MKIRPSQTIGKIVVVLFITLGVLGAISFFSFRSYREFSDALDKLYNQPDETLLTENILTNIGSLESHARAYSLTLENSDLKVYIRNVEDINRQIDSLYRKSLGSAYQHEVDTLRILFNDKVQSFENLIEIKVAQSQKEIDRSALRALSRTQETLLKDSLLVPRQEITTTTTTRTQALEEKKDDDPNLFQRVFGGKKDKKEEKLPVKSEVRQEKTIAYDSAYFEKVDTLITSARRALEEAEQQRQQQSALLTGKELAMVANDQHIYQQLRSIILKIKQLEVMSSTEDKQQTLSIARRSFTSVIVFAICGGLLAMVLIYFVIRDILSAHRLQQQLASAKGKAERLASVKEEFLANMSHEIRTPLNAIIGFSEQMASDELSDEQKERLHKVRSSSDHLLMLVNDILDYSKIESGKLRLENIGFKGSTVVHESLATLEHLATAKGVELRSEVDPQLEELILSGDPIRLKQILINLAGNGVKFTDTGYVKISAHILEEKLDETIIVEFLVEDTGKGIAPDKLESIFEEFGQEDTSISRRYGGTGLGLTISRKLVKMLDGEISVKSEPGQGSIFRIAIPYHLGESDDFSGKFDPERVEINLKGKKLLLIDDDSMNHILLKPSFERWGLDFSSCYNGEDGIERGSDEYFDFILVDYQMPGKSGLEVIDALRREDSLSRYSRIVLCTANAMIFNSREKVLDKIDATLLKPFKEYEIAAILAGVSESASNSSSNMEYTLTNFKTFAGDDPQILREFLESFIENNRENLKLLHTYFEEGEYHEVGDTAHKMKNTFGQLEAEEIMQQLIELEKLVDNTQPDRLIAERIAKVALLSERLFTLLDADISELKSQTSSP